MSLHTTPGGSVTFFDACVIVLVSITNPTNETVRVSTLPYIQSLAELCYRKLIAARISAGDWMNPWFGIQSPEFLIRAKIVSDMGCQLSSEAFAFGCI
jgi:hypothetical protein